MKTIRLKAFLKLLTVLSAVGLISMAQAAIDFDADQGSGRVNPVSSNANHILIRDYNSAVYDIWYTVYAKCSGDKSVINSDPRVENDGTGHQ